MKVTKHLSMLALLSSAILLTHSASAYVVNYSSKPLAFIEGYLDGDVSDSVGLPDFEPYSFTVAFNGGGSSSTVELLSGDVTVELPDYPNSFSNVAANNSSLRLNQNGSIAGWDFLFAFEQHIPQTYDDQPYDSRYYLESHYGANTCNCDVYKTDWDYYIRRQETWQFGATIGFLYAGSNSLDNWIIETAEVPEPRTYVLLLLGLIAVVLTRIRSRNIFNFPM